MDTWRPILIDLRPMWESSGTLWDPLAFWICYFFREARGPLERCACKLQRPSELSSELDGVSCGALLKPCDMHNAHWDPLEPTGAHWNPLEPTGTHWNPLEPTGAHWSPPQRPTTRGITKYCTAWGCYSGFQWVPVEFWTKHIDAHQTRCWMPGALSRDASANYSTQSKRFESETTSYDSEATRSGFEAKVMIFNANEGLARFTSVFGSSLRLSSSSGSVKHAIDGVVFVPRPQYWWSCTSRHFSCSSLFDARVPRTQNWELLLLSKPSKNARLHPARRETRTG